MGSKEMRRAHAHRALTAKPTKAERRAGWRFGCGAARLTRLYLPETQEFLYGWMHDISAGGIAFDVLKPLADGQQLNVQLRTSDTDRAEFPARVVHVSYPRGFCRVGCKFAQHLPPALFNAIVQQLRNGAEAARIEIPGAAESAEA
jgi:hypothetical protein